MQNKDSYENQRSGNPEEPIKGEEASLSPPLCTFLDGLAELIAEAIIEKTAEGTIVGSKNSSYVPTSLPEEPAC